MPAGQSHAATPGELAVELVREKLYRRLNQELPYRLTVTLEGVTPGPPAGQGLTIYIGVGAATKLIKSIVVGKGGAVIQKYVSEPTQGELSRILKQQVQLVVSVRVTG
jgi:GTP-binding protein Era